MAFEFQPVRPAGLNISGDEPLKRLASLGLSLPNAPGAVAAYVPWAITGNLLMTSGQLPWVDGALLYKGKIGKELTPEQGYDACQLATLNAIAQLADALGDLRRVRRIVRLEGTLNVAPGFTSHPPVLNGASDLIFAVFANAGRHTRMIYTNPEMPLDCACLIVIFAEIEAK
jgi:enamine deaminase RidA (YjgF/YER057c/UK114 family)